MINLLKLSNELKRSQHQTDDPDKSERLLADAFNAFGLPAKHLGGANKPDILIEYGNEKIVVDAKTVQTGSAIGEPSLGFPAQARYKEKYNAKFVAIVGPSFRSGNTIESAKKYNVILIETSAICKLLEWHNMCRYNKHKIYNMLFNGGNTMVTETDIQPPYEERRPILKVVNYMLNELFQRSDTLTIKEVCTALNLGKGEKFDEGSIKQSMEFLERFNIVTKQEESYRLTRKIEEILDDIGLLCQVKQPNGEGTKSDTEGGITPKGPPVPDIDLGNAPKFRKTFYEQLKTDGTLANFIRNFIYQNKQVSHSQIVTAVKENNWEETGGIVATLEVLRDNTKEIEQTGRAADRSYKWIGR